MARLRPAQFDEHLTLVEHLDELAHADHRLRRCRCVVAVGLCFWQNALLLDIANAPLPGDRVPITFGVTEPFMTTVTLSVYARAAARDAGDPLPALRLRPARVLAAASGASCCPSCSWSRSCSSPASSSPTSSSSPRRRSFLLNFNADEFNIEVRAREYYSFFALTLISVGVLFQIPVGILAVTRLGIVTPETLARNRRYAVLVIAVVAMLLPGTDPVTMLISMLPLLAPVRVQPAARARTSARPEPEGEPAGAGEGAEPALRQWLG